MTYRERREARAERLRGWAESRGAQAAAATQSGHERLDVIPFGQPVHGVRDANYRAKARRQLERGHELGKLAESHEERAAGIESQLRTSVYSDDVDAVEALEERIRVREARRDRIKAFNASARRGAPEFELLEPAEREELLGLVRIGSAFVGKGGGFPRYVLANLSADVKRNRDRLEQLRRQREAAEAGVRVGGRPMASRYPGECADCGEAFERGAPIVWYRSTREAVHAPACPGKDG